MDWFGGQIEMVQYVRRALGYSLTGSTREECLFYLWGPQGRNGKGTLINTVARILGNPLAKGVQFSTFQNERQDPQGFQLAPLHNARLAVASEGQSVRLNESLIKTITGRDAMQVAFKRRDAFEMIPQFKLWLMSQHQIKGDPDDDAFWRRWRLIEFSHSYIGKEDKTLKDQLLTPDNRRGILAWAILGAMRWYATGLGEPAIMEEKLGQYRDDNDGVGRFLGDCTIKVDGGEVGLDALYAAYKDWCESEGTKEFSRAWLGRRLKAKGFADRRNTNVRPSVRYIVGLKLA